MRNFFCRTGFRKRCLKRVKFFVFVFCFFPPSCLRAQQAASRTNERLGAYLCEKEEERRKTSATIFFYFLLFSSILFSFYLFTCLCENTCTKRAKQQNLLLYLPCESGHVFEFYFAVKNPVFVQVFDVFKISGVG